MSRRTSSFPFVDWDELLSHRKARKNRDFKRMLESPRSEDWVTWNVMRAMQQRPSREWWPELVNLAQGDSPDSYEFLAAAKPPTIHLWHNVPTPVAYERASRRRMARSDDLESRQRADNPSPVEGETEVDVVFEGADYLVFAEAKLGSDISLRTKHDPNRNQIARNIDCVIDEAGGRRPYFWLLVRDRNEAKVLRELVDGYRGEPPMLAAVLNHRHPGCLERVARSIAVIEWRELLALLPDAPELRDVIGELRRRVE